MTFTTLITIVGWMIAGGLAIFGVLNKQWRAREDEADSVAQRLIENLEATVDQQERTINKQAELLEATRKEMHQMQGRNTVLEELFNGSENSILSFLKQTPELMKIARENHTYNKTNSEEIGKLTVAVEQLVEALRPPKP